MISDTYSDGSVVLTPEGDDESQLLHEFECHMVAIGRLSAREGKRLKVWIPKDRVSDFIESLSK